MTDDQHDPHIEIGVTIPIAVVHADCTVIPNEVIERAESHIQEYGFCLVGDGVEYTGEGERPVTYSIGLHKRDLPDIISLGSCGCHDKVIDTIARRQLQAGAYDDGQITQIHGVVIRLSVWPHSAGLNMFNTYYARLGGLPRLLLAEAIA